MKKVMILTVGLGGGHKAMARNLSQMFDAHKETVEVKIVDVLHEAWPAFSDKTSQVYAGSTSSARSWLFRLYYVLSDTFPQPLQWASYLLFRRHAREAYARERPDLFVVTFPFISDIASKARDYHHGKTKIIQTITDARRVQGIWLSKYADMTLTATPDTVGYLVKRGMNPDKVAYVGFPASKVFYTPSSRPAVRAKLGLDPKAFTIILTAGGQGLNPEKVLEVAREIGKIRQPYQIILNAGQNNELKQQFLRVAFPKAKKVIVEGFTDKMVEYLQASDVICTKSGWLTINEALVLQRPLVLYDAIPGHEEQNAQYVTENNFGVYAPEPKQVRKKLERLMKNPNEFDAHITSMKTARTNKDPYQDLSAFMMSYLIKNH